MKKIQVKHNIRFTAFTHTVFRMETGIALWYITLVLSQVVFSDTFEGPSYYIQEEFEYVFIIIFIINITVVLLLFEVFKGANYALI